MRLLRTVALVVALSPLISAPTASAECAWVPWAESIHDNGEIVWATVEAEARPRASIPLTYRFFCLPDTVDPREPKGK